MVCEVQSKSHIALAETAMPIQAAIYHAVRSYPGGAAALAPQMLGRGGGPMSGAVLSNKVNPHDQANHLTVDEFCQMVDLTGNTLPVEALVALFSRMGLHLFKGELPEAPGDGALMESLLNVNQAVGNLSGCINFVLADGVLTEQELRAVQAKMSELFANLAAVQETLSRMAEK